jgi:hypothetical protein
MREIIYPSKLPPSPEIKTALLYYLYYSDTEKVYHKRIDHDSDLLVNVSLRS